MDKAYIHQPLGQEITAIGGHYVVTDEIRIPFDGKVILYLRGYAITDTSCCGMGGCAFVHVKGFVKSWKGAMSPEGLEISQYETIEDEGLQKKIREIIQSKEVFHQVQFD